MQQPELGQTIKNIRLQKRLTQANLAQQCNVNIRTIQRIEKGEVLPRFFTLNLLSKVLDYSFSQETSEQVKLVPASFAKRTAAYFIDYLVLSIPVSIIMASAAILTPPDVSTQLRVAAPWLFLIFGIYFILFWSLPEGATVGMAILNIGVVRKDGTRSLILRNIVRFLGCIISIIPLHIGFLWMLFDRHQQGWHDKIAGTIVIEKSQKVY
jgi:uncharacterized RDD family membrane protein YckC